MVVALLSENESKILVNFLEGGVGESARLLDG